MQIKFIKDGKLIKEWYPREPTKWNYELLIEKLSSIIKQNVEEPFHTTYDIIGVDEYKYNSSDDEKIIKDKIDNNFKQEKDMTIKIFTDIE